MRNRQNPDHKYKKFGTLFFILLCNRSEEAVKPVEAAEYVGDFVIYNRENYGLS